MTEQEMRWFEALTKDRMESADTLEKASMRGVQRSVVDKYSDQAHFIYELLQNADDVKATSCHFRLEKHGLFFIHNGSIGFTVSDPKNEDVDSLNGSLGHVNSITSIANSNKPESSIGKFGVGFKAVFQYTQTPHVYDPRIRFKIDRFIVPHLLDEDLDWREASNTVFWFPFDQREKTPEESSKDVSEKLKSLDLPLLFLSHLKSISFEGSELSGKYSKKVKKLRYKGEIAVQRVEATLELNGKKSAQRMLIFASEGEHCLQYCIGYSLSNDGKLAAMDRPAFCFFPTKEVTNLNFIIHAPFLLTDSREGIKAGEKHNQEMIQQLAQLAADSLPILRDQGLISDWLLDVIPYDLGKFNAIDDRRKISFRPFFTAIKSKLQSDNLLPAGKGKCSQKGRSYWASDTELVELFSDKQLEQLTKTKFACWVFRSRGKKEVQNGNKALAEYIDGGDARAIPRRESNLIVSSLDPEAVLKKINSHFIVSQSQKWLHKFYRYLSERTSYQTLVKEMPIFLDQNGNAASAFDKGQQLILFLPDDDIEGYTTVNKGLLSKKSTREFIEKFGIKKPSLRDEIYNKILPAYSSDDAIEIDTDPHFVKFFRYFRECRNDKVTEFLALIKEKEFLSFTTAESDIVFRGKAADIYLPTSDLKEWFETKPNTKFLRLDFYYQLIGAENHERLHSFLVKLGVWSSPRVIGAMQTPDLQYLNQRNLSIMGHSHRLLDKIIDGFEEIIAGVNARRSVLLWRLLPGVIQELSGSHSWFYYKSQDESFESRAEHRLRSAQWILNNAGELVSADSLTIQSLSDQYNTASAGAKSLIAFLRIKDIETEHTSHLSDVELGRINFARELEESGLSEDEIRTAITDAKHKKSTLSNKGCESPVIRDIESRRPSIKNSGSHTQTINPPIQPNHDSEDADEYTPKLVDYGQKLDRAKDRYASELDRIEREQMLHERANGLPRYSYGWFLALLELECMASGEQNADGNTISISFGKVGQDDQSSRTIVLSEPNRFIPQSIEEFSGVRVDLDFGSGRSGRLRVESFTAKEFSLHGKLESISELEGMDLSEVLKAHIEVQNPSFLLQELLGRFRDLQFDEMFDMHAGLTPDIEFVFGPPGTGKTTHLVSNVLIPKMGHGERVKVLVLTPTNKAADVLTTRIIQKMGQDKSYRDWLVRFGTSADERIEEAGVWRDRSFNIHGLDRLVTVTTVARFAYDGFAGVKGRRLHEMEWDIIVIDEASMISLPSFIRFTGKNPRSSSSLAIPSKSNRLSQSSNGRMRTSIRWSD